MTQSSNPAVNNSPAALPASESETLFGIPIGELGWFATLLIGFASAFAAFFTATFCSIVALLVYNTATHSTVDYALTYRAVGLPIGLLVLVIALGYLGTLWCKRIFRRA
jgi:predicted branched-subunit amino acid permease